MAPRLSYFQSEQETMVETDASEYTMKVVLSQQVENSKIYSYAFLSRKFSPAEINYNIYDKKITVIIQAFKKWESVQKSC